MTRIPSARFSASSCSAIADGGRRATVVSSSAMAEQLEAENRADGMRVVGDWPYDDT